MKRLIFFCVVLLVAGTVRAQESGLGIGIILGEPTGLSAKLWTTEDMAMDAGLAWSFTGTGYVRIHTDLLWHRRVFDVGTGSMPLYYGLGAKLLLASELGLGIRIPAGLAYQFESAPIDIFVELVPGLNLLPATTLDVVLALGARYFL